MKFYHKYYEPISSYKPEKREIISRAESALIIKPPHITDSIAPDSAGGRHDFFSQADYSWPDPNTSDGLPFINRDGESYPGAFFEHRKAMRRMRTSVAYFTAAYTFTKDVRYSKAASLWLKEFFLDEETMMMPSLLYSQAILGRCTGRGIGIIDTLHLIDVPICADILFENGQMDGAIYSGLKDWFSKYLNWICTHQYGIDEMNTKNNHSVCWLVQATVFARFSENDEVLEMCISRYKNTILPNQMAVDGSFPLELERTKPYGYTIFVLDNLATLCYLLSTPKDNLWEFTLPDGRNMKKGIDYLYTYLDDKTIWPHKHDIACYDEWPVAMSFMLFAAASYGESKWLDLYSRLEKFPNNDEVRRNTAIRVPWLWIYPYNVY
ncbi:MAG: alginate lyase family protein [Treponema sp.]|jgi:hypothetical protein|nr:alginate lyase family protein [Treponema sp.]